MFASTLNGIAASVRCVSSIIAVMNVKLKISWGVRKHKTSRWEMKKLDKSDVFASLNT